MPNPFHLAIAVRDISEADRFYTETLGLEKGRSASHWIDFNLFGHQFVVHLDESLGPEGRIQSHCNNVDRKSVPVPHFGVVLPMAEWQQLADRLTQADVSFIIEPYIRFQGEPGEQGTLFFEDPTGNALEFKGFHDIENQLFAT